MSESDSTKVYNNYVRANLPNGMSYDTGTGLYDINNHSFFTFKNSNWYYKYISKYGYSAISAYAVNGFDPALVFDFKENYYRKSATDSTFAASITHTASSNATMVDSDGLLKWRPHNNVTKSNTFSTWTRSFVTAVDNAVVGPTGIANTASTVNFSSAGSKLYNLTTVAVSAGDKVTLAAWVRSDTITSLTFALNGRINGANNTQEANLSVPSTWTLVTFEANVLGNDTGLWFLIGKHNAASPFAQIGELEMYGAHMYRSDLGGMVNNSEQPTGFGTYVPTTTTAVYGPRTGHHIYNGSAWVNEGILHESEARTNLVANSNDLTAAEWKVVAASNSANVAVSPDGTSNANKVVTTTSYNRHFTYLEKNLNSVSGSHSFSVYVAAAGYGFATVCVGSDGALDYYAVVIDLSNGTKTATYTRGTQTDKTCTLEAVGSYYRVTISGDGERFYIVGPADTGTYTTGGYGFKEFSADGTSGILVYGAQLEAGLTGSSYIPTSGSAATRAADLLTVPAANLPYSSTNMSIQMDGKMTYADGITSSEVEMYRWILSSSNYINSTVQAYAHKTGEPVFSQRQASSGLDSVVGSGSTYAPDTDVPLNIAVRHGSTFINAAINGTALTANTTPTALPDLSVSVLTLGFDFMGTIGQFRMWSDDLTDAGIVEAST